MLFSGSVVNIAMGTHIHKRLPSNRHHHFRNPSSRCCGSPLRNTAGGWQNRMGQQMANRTLHTYTFSSTLLTTTTAPQSGRTMPDNSMDHASKVGFWKKLRKTKSTTFSMVRDADNNLSRMLDGCGIPCRSLLQEPRAAGLPLWPKRSMMLPPLD